MMDGESHPSHTNIFGENMHFNFGTFNHFYVDIYTLLDRLTHRCQVLDFDDESWRLAHRKSIF